MPGGIMRRLFRAAAAAALFVVAGCSQQTVVERTAPKDAVALAEKTVSDFRAQDTASLERDFAPGRAQVVTDNPMVRSFLRYFPKEQVTAVHIVAWHNVSRVGNVENLARWWNANIASNTITYVTLRYEFRGGDALLVSLTMASDFGRLRVYGMDAVPLPRSLIQANAFDAPGKSGQYLFLLIILFDVAFVIVSLVACWQTPQLRLKWLWLFVTLSGTGEFWLNWTTGDVRLAPLVLKLIPFGAAQASPYQPLSIWFVLPTGAIAFWIMKTLRRTPTAPDAPAAGEAPASDMKD